MKTLVLILSLIFFFRCGSNESKKNVDEIDSLSKRTTYKKENFNVFLSDFSKDSSFQLSRVAFPFNDCYVEPTGDSLCETIDKSKWIHFELIEEGEVKTVDNIKTGSDSNERIFSIEGIENGTGSYYYFKRDKGKWYLKRRLSYE